jgi:hypothetical protein
MKRFILYLLVILISYNVVHATEDDWKKASSTHFLVYYKNAPEDFIKQLIDKSEDYYNKIAQDLGFTRFNFWLWENRAKIYIHDNPQEFQSATGQPAWSAGCAEVNTKIIHSFPYAQGFTETILPHEMGHIVFREFVGFDNPSIPLWLDEGVAAYEEHSRYISADIITREAIRTGKFINLVRLSSISQNKLQENNLVKLFYSEAVSLVDFLIKEFGRDKFVYFCQNLRDKKDLERAISASYPFSNIQELDEGWQKYLQK